MKKAQIRFAIFLCLISFCSLPVRADVALESNADLVGVWTLVATAKDLDGGKRPSGNSWEFRKDGTLATSGYDSRLPGGNFSVSSSYEVKDGKIVAEVPGRPGKKMIYTVIEKDRHYMIIKQGIGQIMFFSKK